LLAARLDRDFYDADHYHPPANVEKMRRGEPLSDADREPWLDALRALIDCCAREDRPAVLACSALKAAHRDRLGVDQSRAVSVFLRGAEDLIAARLAGREHAFMPPSLLRSQFEALEPPAGGIQVEVDAPPEAIVEQIVAALSA
jgi:gluconokinase